MVHDLNPKNLHINKLIFLQNPKKPYLQGIFGHYPRMRFFPNKNPGEVSEKSYEWFWRDF